MLKWLSKLPLFKQVYRQGGIDSFALAQKDVLETMRDDLDKQVEELAQKKVKDLFSIVDWNEVVSLNKQQGTIFIGNERINETRLANLKAEAEFFAQADLWKLIYETPKGLAHQIMFVSGDSIEDMKKGRSILFTLDSQKNIIDLFRSYTPKK